MRLLRDAILICGMMLGISGPARSQPPQGSQLNLEDNACALCHAEADRWRQSHAGFFVPPRDLTDDAHWVAGVNCHDCHGGDPTTLDEQQAHSTTFDKGSRWQPFGRPGSSAMKVCQVCHATATVELRKGVHAHAGPEDKEGDGTVLACGECHGQRVHGMRSRNDTASPVYLDHQVTTCGRCHEKDEATYKQTVHGQGLDRSGLVVVAVCSDCHGPHGTYYAADKRSTLHRKNIAVTCGKCHEYLADRLEHSVHGQSVGEPGKPAEPSQTAQGAGHEGKASRYPVCTDCHQGHRLLNPESGQFREELKNRCGNCHADLANRYAMSTHGELTARGYVPAATCSDCHDSHDMLPIGDPNSRLADGERRLATCRKCHANAVMNFSQYDPHANHKDETRYPAMHLVYVTLTDLLYVAFVLFMIHAFLWFVRSLAHTLRVGRHRTLVAGQYAIMRSELGDRGVYVLLLCSFLGLMITGLMMKYGAQEWAQLFSLWMGGIHTVRIIHHFFAVGAIVGCTVHLIRTLARQFTGDWRPGSGIRRFFGPDSPLPMKRDWQDLYHMLRWFVGLGPKPAFGRWTYWEKFDYWAVYLAGTVIGLSGLMLWYPNVFCRVLPGSALNVAKIVHTHIAVLAASFLFVIHFFHTHFRPEKFPMDLSVVTGLVSEEHLRKNRPEYIARLEASGELDRLRRRAPSSRRLGWVFLAGSVVLTSGLLLMGIAIIASLGH